MRVAVAGGGIAGLTSAIALAARGFEVDLYERAPVLEEIGAGIQLSPNAMAVLERLGVAGDLEGSLSEPEALVVRDARSAAILARIPLGKTARQRYGAPYCTLHRADLQASLLAAARRHAAITFHLGAEVRDVRGTEKEVGFIAGGENRQSEILVAADGVRSAIRTSHFQYPGPTSLGHSAWRATLPAAEVADRVPLDEIGLWLGAGAHLVHYPIANGTELNIVLISGEDPEPRKAAFRQAARRLIDHVPLWMHSPLAAVDPAQPWARGRVALIGDAAHAIAPSAAQGGAQAIEDAWVLAASLAGKSADPARALTDYARLRQPRVERVARLASRNLNLYEMKRVPALLRNSLLRTLPATLMLSRLDWLFGWRPQ